MSNNSLKPKKQKECTTCTKSFLAIGYFFKKEGRIKFTSKCNFCRNQLNLAALRKRNISNTPNEAKKSVEKTDKENNKKRLTWAQRNKERMNALNKNWRENNKEKWSIINRTNKSRRKDIGKVNIDLWNLKLKQLNFSCACCGSKENITIDHILPVVYGGNNSIDNLQPLCLSCNKKKYTKHIDYINKINYQPLSTFKK